MNICSKRLNENIDKWIGENTDNIVKDIISFVNIKSIASKRHGNYPYGTDCAKALDYILEISKNYGFIVRNDEYYYGTCELRGKTNEKEIGIFAHLDVVPEGSRWTYDPYNAVLKDGYLIGRGSADNKGPLIAALYALKYLKDNNITLNNRIKLYYGCCEEAGMPDIEYYLQHNKAPDFSLIPDAEFPVCYAEKGILEITAYKDIKEGNLKEINAGEVSNVVPEYAYAVIDGIGYDETVQTFATEEGVEIEKLESGIKIKAFGSSRHAAYPEGSVSAIGKLASALIKHNLLTGDAISAVKFIGDSVADYNGTSIGIAYEDKPSGKLTHISGILRLENGRLSVNYNIRYPVTVNQDEMISKVKKTLDDAGFNIIILKNNLPLFTSLSDPVIHILCDISNEVMQKEFKPYLMGGGTYARKLPYAVGYGMGIKDQKPLFNEGRGGAHQPDECLNIENLLKGVKIYINALLSIDKFMDDSLK